MLRLATARNFPDDQAIITEVQPQRLIERWKNDEARTYRYKGSSLETVVGAVGAATHS